MSEEWTNKEVRKMDELDALKADRDRLDEILGEAEGMLSEYHEEIGRYVPDGIRVLLAERDRYREALKMFIEHDEECLRDHNWCSCGAYAARAALNRKE